MPLSSIRDQVYAQADLSVWQDAPVVLWQDAANPRRRIYLQRCGTQGLVGLFATYRPRCPYVKCFIMMYRKGKGWVWPLLRKEFDLAYPQWVTCVQPIYPEVEF